VYSDAACLEWFRSYLEGDSTEIEPAGTMKLCEDLNVAPENVALLVIAWKATAAKMGTFTSQEWLGCMQPLRVADAPTLASKLPQLTQLLDDPATFKDVFRYAYQYLRSALENPAQKSIDKESAMSMLKVLLTGRWSQLPLFLEFLKQHNIKVITRDQWQSIHEFQATVGDSLAAYNVDSAWPVLLDEYVEWARENGHFS